MFTKKLFGIAGAVSILVVPWLIGHFSQDLESAQSFCPFKMISGMPCPGCGITKSIYFFYEGNLEKSLSYHLLGPFVVAFSILVIAILGFELFTHKSWFNRWLYNSKLAWTLGISLAVYHSYRLASFLLSHSLHEIMKESIWQ